MIRFAFFLTAFLTCLVLSGAKVSAQEPAEKDEPENVEELITEEFPLDDPFYNERFVKSWARRMGLAAMSLTFVTYEDTLDRSKKSFTKAGYARFVSGLEETGMLQMIEEAQVSISVAMRGQPDIIDKGVVDGRYRWVIEIPIMLFMRNMKTQVRDYYMLRMVIVRSNELHLPQAIAIDEWATISMQDPLRRVR